MQISGEEPDGTLEIKREPKNEVTEQIISEMDSLWTEDYEVSAMRMLRESIKSS